MLLMFGFENCVCFLSPHSSSISIYMRVYYIYIYIYNIIFTSKCHRKTTPSPKRSNYDKVLKPPSLPINTKVKDIEPLQDEMMSYIYTNLPVNAIVRLPNPWSENCQGQETFLAPSADNQTCNYDKVLKLQSLPINTDVKGIEL